jgi:hypothetical protein
MTDYTHFVPDHWKQRFKWDSITPDQQKAIGEYGSYMFRLASPTVSDIDEVKYDGRLVVLDDGTRWEVGSAYVDDVDSWLAYGKVVVLDDVMYRLEEAEHADVTQEL